MIMDQYFHGFLIAELAVSIVEVPSSVDVI